MSRSPTGEKNQSPSGEYLDAWERLALMIQEGRSFSGHERNSCFLNLGRGRFADVSAAAGLDQIDDSRAYALCDWDADGDLDLWLTNRTGPRVRFLRNEIPREGRFLEVGLTGDPKKRVNRDAIGARLELHLSGETPRRIYRTLYAGEGFLSQSSKWVHFGLGEAARIEKLTVRWPGSREAEEFTGLEPGKRYRLLQGSGRAETVAARPEITLAPSVPEAPPLSGRARIRLSSLPRLPEASYQGFDGRPAPLPAGPLLVNLWGTWCAPCLKELQDLAGSEARIRGKRLAVLALSVDGLRESGKADPAAVKGVLAAQGFPFAAGLATADLLERLERALWEAIYRRRPLPLPSSFLLDRERRLAVVYQGPLEIEELLRDLDTLEVADPAKLRDLAVPFAGRWARDVFITNPVAIAGLYLEGGDPDDAREHLKGWLEAQREPPAGEKERSEWNLRLADVHLFLGRIAQGERKGREAVEAYQTALAHRPAFPPAANNLAWILATHPDAGLRNGPEAVRLARAVCSSSGEKEAPPLDTLAAACAETGDFAEAVRAASKALDLARNRGQSRMAADIEQRLALYLSGRPFREN